MDMYKYQMHVQGEEEPAEAVVNGEQGDHSDSLSEKLSEPEEKDTEQKETVSEVRFCGLHNIGVSKTTLP